jgi:hypothetical protein
VDEAPWSIQKIQKSDGPEQSKRFEEAAKALGVNESGGSFD